jgi:uncharacterized C2H2 Zn-finger protein
MNRAPQRIYRCPDCGYITEYRWVLARHLYQVHMYYKKDAANIAIENQYVLSTMCYRKRDLLRRYEEAE